MSGLLMALQDVIGPSSSDEDEEEEEMEEEHTTHNITHSFAEELSAFDSQTLIGTEFDSQTLVAESSTDSTTPRGTRNISPYSDDSGHASTAEDDTADLSVLFGSEDYHSEEDDQPTVRLPISRKSQPPPPNPEMQPEPSPRSELEPHSEVDRRSLLSPVSLSLSPTSKVTLPGFSREDSIDSGYADCESWSGPEPLAMSPPPNVRGVRFAVESPSPGSQSGEDELRGRKMWVRMFENGEEVDPSEVALPLDEEEEEEEVVMNFVVGDDDDDTSTSLAYLKFDTSYQDEVSPAAIALPLSPPSPLAPSSPELEFPSFSEFVQASRAGTPIQFLDDDSDEEDEEGVDPRGIALPLSPDLSSSSGFPSFSQVVQSTLPFLEDDNEDASMSFGDTEPAAESSFALSVQDEQGPVTPTPTHQPLSAAPSPSHRQKWGAVVNELSLLSLDIAPLEEKEAEEGKERLLSVTPQVKDDTLGEVYGAYDQDLTTSSVYSQQTEEDPSNGDVTVSESVSSTEGSSSTPGSICILDFPLPPTNTAGLPSSSSATQRVFTPPLVRGQMVSTESSASSSSSSSSSTPPASTGRVFTPPLARGKAESPFSTPPDTTERVFTPPLVGGRMITDSPPSPSGSSSSASSSTPPAPTSALPLTRGRTDTTETIRPGAYQSYRASSLSRPKTKSPPSPPRSGKGKGKAPMKDGDKSHEWDEAMDAGNVSTKAPFGFRYPYSLVCPSCLYYFPLYSQGFILFLLAERCKLFIPLADHFPRAGTESPAHAT